MIVSAQLALALALAWHPGVTPGQIPGVGPGGGLAIMAGAAEQSAGKDDPWLEPPPADQPQPKFACTQTEIDAGDVWGAQRSYHTFEISNAGQAPLKMRFRCTCATEVLGPRRRIVEPGMTDSVLVEMYFRRGHRSNWVTAYTNDREHPCVKLTTVATGRKALLFDPPWPGFGRIPRAADSQTTTVTITRGDGGPIQPSVIPIRQDSPKLTTLTGLVREIEAGERYELDVTVHPPWPTRDCPWARMKSTKRAIWLETGVPQSPLESVTVSAIFERRLRASPWHIMIPSRRNGPVELRCVLEWAGNAPPGKITDFTWDAPELTAELTEEDGKHVIVVRVPPEYRLPEGVSRAITVRTDDPEVKDGTLTIPIVAEKKKKSRWPWR